MSQTLHSRRRKYTYNDPYFCFLLSPLQPNIKSFWVHPGNWAPVNPSWIAWPGFSLSGLTRYHTSSVIYLKGTAVSMNTQAKQTHTESRENPSTHGQTGVQKLARWSGPFKVIEVGMTDGSFPHSVQLTGQLRRSTGEQGHTYIHKHTHTLQTLAEIRHSVMRAVWLMFWQSFTSMNYFEAGMT